MHTIQTLIEIVMSKECSSHPFGKSLQVDEALLWCGRPNKAKYTGASRTWRDKGKIFAWASIPLVVSTIGIICDDDLVQRYVCAIFIVATLVVVAICFAQVDYSHASWYAFSDKNIYLAHWDENDFVIHRIEISNLEQVNVTNVIERIDVEGKDDIGTIECICHSMISTLFSKKFFLYLVDDPALVQSSILNVMGVGKRK